MLLKLFVTISVGIALVSANCTPCPPFPPHLAELGCTGQYVSPSHCCFQKFECPDISQQDNSKCYYKGKAYNVGEKLTNEELGPCRTCTCHAGDAGNSATFHCDGINCSGPGSNAPYARGCLPQYKQDKCCEDNFLCGEEKNNVYKCDYRDKQYYKGQKFIHDSNPCYECICDENFTNSSAPTWFYTNKQNCKPINCNVWFWSADKVKQGCSPVYSADACCPVDWVCPKATDKLIEAKNSYKAVSCKFGDLAIHYNDQVDVNDKCVTCKCDLAPFLTCTKTC